MDDRNLSWQKLQRDAERYQSGGKHEEAVQAISQALELPGLAPSETKELLFSRAHSYYMQGEFERSQADLRAVRDLAESEGDDRGQVTALQRLTEISCMLSRQSEAERLADQAREMAGLTSDAWVAATAHNTISLVYLYSRNNQAALEQGQMALESFTCLGDRSGELESLRMIALVKGITGSKDSLDYIHRGLAVARQIHDRRGEAIFLNLLALKNTLITKNIAFDRQHKEAAAAIFREIGDLRYLSLVSNNLAVLYYHLGLYRRAMRYASDAVQNARKMKATNLAGYLTVYSWALTALGRHEEAECAIGEQITIVEEFGGKFMVSPFPPLLSSGQIKLKTGDPQAALEQFQNASAILSGRSEYPTSLSLEAAAYLALNDLPAADRVSAQAVDILSTHGTAALETFAVYDVYWFQNIYWYRYCVLKRKHSVHGGDGLPEDAWQVLQEARRQMLEQIATLSDEGLRRNYLNKPPINKAILLEWAHQAHQLGQAVEEPQAGRALAAGRGTLQAHAGCQPAHE
jgi:tetratricopeptide (TPR) repeat protein